MEFLKNSKIVIAIVAIILVLVIIRSTSINRFRSDAKRWAEPSVARSNTITPEQARNLQGNILTINLDNKMIPDEKVIGALRNIPADSILSKNIIKSILKQDGPVLIYSSQTALSARIWMVISQMGCRKIFILTDLTDNELPKYKFRPDTIMH
jgi:uncharacterized membrane protein YvbJ